MLSTFFRHRYGFLAAEWRVLWGAFVAAQRILETRRVSLLIKTLKSLKSTSRQAFQVLLGWERFNLGSLVLLWAILRHSPNFKDDLSDWNLVQSRTISYLQKLIWVSAWESLVQQGFWRYILDNGEALPSPSRRAMSHQSNAYTQPQQPCICLSHLSMLPKFQGWF